MGICVMGLTLEAAPRPQSERAGGERPVNLRKAEANLCVPARLTRRAAKGEGRRPHSHGAINQRRRRKSRLAPELLDRGNERGARGRHMGAAAFRRLGPVAALEPVDVDQVLAHGGDVALLLVAFVPLVMIVEDHRYEIVEADDEAVARSVVDEAMEPLVELREVGKSALRLIE